MKIYTEFTTDKDIVYVRELDDDGSDQLLRLMPSVSVYKEAGSRVPNTKYVSMRNDPLFHKSFSSVGEAKRYIDSRKHLDRLFYNHRYMYDTIDDKYQNIDIDSMKSRLNVAYLDIEIDISADGSFPRPDRALQPISAITLFTNNKFHVFGLNHDLRYKQSDLVYHKCACESEMLMKFITVWSKLYPHIISGWNIKGFDIPYLVNRITIVLGETAMKELSPWKRVTAQNSMNKFGKEEVHYGIMGVSTLDYYDLYLKFRLTRRDSYKLKNIAAVEGLTQQKREYEGSLTDLMLNDPEEYLLYNLDDVKTVMALDEELNYIGLVVRMSYNAKVNFVDVFSQVRMWECMIMNEMKSRGIIAEQNPNANHKDSAIEGAFVMEPKPGPSNWVVTLDLDSMYPSIMNMLNISPETINPESVNRKLNIEEFLINRPNLWTDPSMSVAGNGVQFFNHKEGILPSMLAKMRADRKTFKGLMLSKKKLKQSIERELKLR